MCTRRLVCTDKEAGAPINSGMRTDAATPRTSTAPSHPSSLQRRAFNPRRCCSCLVPAARRQHARHAAPQLLRTRVHCTATLSHSATTPSDRPCSPPPPCAEHSSRASKMSCGYGTPGFQCDKVYTLGDRVTPQRAQEIYDLGQRLGFTDFNPTSVDWDSPITSAHTRPRAAPQPQPAQHLALALQSWHMIESQRQPLSSLHWRTKLSLRNAGGRPRTAAS